MNGTSRNDYWSGSLIDEYFDGVGGDDTIFGINGADTLVGGLGNDFIVPGEGAALVLAGDGDDLVNGYRDSDGGSSYYPSEAPWYIDLGPGNDFVIASHGSDTIYGGLGHDTIDSLIGHDFIDAGSGDDYVTRSAQTDGVSAVIYGGEGNDVIAPITGMNTVFGGSGDDNINGEYLGSGRYDYWLLHDSQVYDGGDGNDFLMGSSDSDWLLGGAGDNLVYGLAGNDTLLGGSGRNHLLGDEGDDFYEVRSIDTRIYDYEGQDTAWILADYVKVPSSIEVVHYAQGVKRLPYWIDALLPDQAAGRFFQHLLDDGATMQYAFPAIPAYYVGEENLSGWSSLTSIQREAVIDVLDYLQSIINIRFQFTDDVEQANVMSFANNDQIGSSAYANYPAYSEWGSDLYFANDQIGNRQFALGTYAAYTLIHEIAHALGLEHPFGEADARGGQSDPPYLSDSENVAHWTMMSYEVTESDFSSTLSPIDIAALHYLYGPNPLARANDDRYDLSRLESRFIWDGGGVDVIDASSYAKPIYFSLESGVWSYAGTSAAFSIVADDQFTINFGTQIEALIATPLNDVLFGSEINNWIDGGGGNDRIHHDLGHDTIRGGAGLDSYLVEGAGLNFDRDYLGSSHILRDDFNVDILVDIERIEFTDVNVGLDTDITGSSGQTALLIGAVLPGQLAFDESKRELLGNVIELFDAGFTMDQLSGALMRLPIWDTLTGKANYTNTDIANYLWTNVHGVAPTSAELSAGVQALNSQTGEQQGLWLSQLAQSQANQLHINLVGIQETGLIYV